MKRFFIVILCLCLTGCVAMFKPEKRMVSFESNPSGATVLIEKVPVGTTPVKLELTDGVPTDIVLQKDGYAPTGETIQTHEDTFWVIMQNIPLPLLGMVIGGYFENMSILDKTEVSYNLEPMSPGSKPERIKKVKKNKSHKKEEKSMRYL